MVITTMLLAWHAQPVFSAQQTENALPDVKSILTDQCAVTDFNYAPANVPANNIIVSSESALVVKDQLAVFEGDVSITSATSLITADSANILDNGNEIKASGDVQYTDELLQVNSESVEVNSNLKLLQMSETDYKLQGINGRGGADILSISQEQGILLEDVSFTTCPEGGEDWRIQASEISIDKGKPYGEAYNTRFYLGNVPVFYLPYFAFPITTERQTGFLFPQFGSSSTTGLEYEQPFYWNIAPNLDATFSTRLMTNRGLQLKSEFRYLFDNHAGELQIEYLPSDNDRADNDARYFYRYSHRGKLSKNWSIAADISDLSDNNYIIDLGSDYYNQADTYLYRQVGVNYASEALDFSMNVRDFTTIGLVANNYRALPEAKLRYTSKINEWLNIGVNSELAYFENDAQTSPDALRFHIEPSISLPYQRAWGELLAQVSVLHTSYKQDLKNQTSTLDERVDRTLGQGRLYGSLIFEKQQTLFNQEYMLTIEPRAQYLYTSFEDQSAIGLYDSTPLLTNFSNLFRGQEFTGLDRINDNNQVTLGATSRLIDSNNKEVLTVSVGQILYIEDARLIDSQREGNRSSVAAELDWQVNQNWFLHSDIQVGNQSNRVERSSFSTKYRPSESKFLQINHRYIRELSNERIDQIGVSASWPINKDWHWVGRYYRDLKRSRTIESFMGIEYESCCWALRLIVRKNLATRFNNNGVRDLDDFDSGIALQFVFKGMGSGNKKVEMLNQGLFGYRQPFALY
ncbi:LPS-assembly protein LptD [Glaciecola petra]|uniref:LPS-assembly protein LptD n=1 Tax=Glaciecola petra TaxID=3075602 RepID=A0ABU2ZYU6_9ALTE|nr:LPS assembly protein LptD [Aestuariibacter sp. P117]MDT0596602.1 LPS assembly protein LptD [Aestuariibacter sp. P117]